MQIQLVISFSFPELFTWLLLVFRWLRESPIGFRVRVLTSHEGTAEAAASKPLHLSIRGREGDYLAFHSTG